MEFSSYFYNIYKPSRGGKKTNVAKIKKKQNKRNENGVKFILYTGFNSA